jgi:hypothetical protein
MPSPLFANNLNTSNVKLAAGSEHAHLLSQNRFGSGAVFQWALDALIQMGRHCKGLPNLPGSNLADRRMYAQMRLWDAPVGG